MYKIFIVAVLAAGCGAGVSEGVDRSELNQGLCPPGQSPVCHQQEDHCAGPGALDAHLAHGDVEGPCVEIGAPPYEAPPGWTPQVPNAPAQIAEPAIELKVSGGALTSLSAGSAWTPQTSKPPQQLAEDPPDWTPQAPKQPASVCATEVGDACGGTFGGCCDGLRCAWGVCLSGG